MHELISQYEHCPLECDGLTRVLHTALYKAGIEHTCMAGSLARKDSREGSPLHFWIALPEGTFIDYRARMWLGDRTGVPHGIFNPVDYPQVEYSGSPVELEILSPTLFAVLTS
jgi:hypothetical protein